MNIDGPRRWLPALHGPPPCFAGSTPVLTPDGWTPIARIARDASVTSFDTRGGTPAERRVLALKGAPSARIWEVRTHGLDAPIRTTFAHAFLTQRGWVNCWRLRPGERIRVLRADGRVRDDAIREVVRTAAREPVYNLITAGEHTYVAGGAVVHNFAWLRGPRGALADLLHDRRPGPLAAPAPASGIFSRSGHRFGGSKMPDIKVLERMA